MKSSSNWDRARDMVKKQDSSSGTWLKLTNDGDKAVVVFLGEPFAREVCFVDGTYREFNEEMKANGFKPSLRVAFNVALDAPKEVKVLEQAASFFKDVVRVRNKYGLEKWAFEVERHGAAKDPKTTYSILPDHQLTAEEQKEFQSLKLHNLEALYAAPQVEERTITLEDAKKLVEMLRRLSRFEVHAFLKKFKIERIRDLPHAELANAQRFIESFFEQQSSRTEEVDPFA